MAQLSAIDIITGAMRLIGVIGSGETPAAHETADALTALNEILDAWSTENLVLYRNENDKYTAIANKQAITLGPGADWDAARPVTIEGAFVTYNGVDLPLRMLTTEEYNSIAIKDLKAPLPNSLYYVPTYPTASVYLWPIPTTAIPVTLSVNMQFSQFSTAADLVSLPPGYAKALRYTLACALAPEYGVMPRPDVVQEAAEAVASIKNANRQLPVARFDPALTGSGQGSGLGAFLAGYW